MGKRAFGVEPFLTCGGNAEHVESRVVQSENSTPDRAEAQRSQSRSPTLRAVLLYQMCDQLSEWLIYFAVVFSPWAFGTTQPWSIRTMNLVGYALGLMLLVKLFVRKAQGHTPPRWDDNQSKSRSSRREEALTPSSEPEMSLLTSAATETISRPLHYRSLATVAMAALTLCILIYCLISALNASATYDNATMVFSYCSHLPWLPHSYDRARTWHALANYVALAGFFWAVRDWLLGKTKGEARAEHSETCGTSQSFYLPARLRRLLWVLSINGGLLAIEGMAQRLSGTNQLLWFQPTHDNKEADSQFGPYAYRANAAQYFNLLWPLALALWWTTRREIRRKLAPLTTRRTIGQIVLLAAILVMVACPIMGLSRGGAAVTAGNMAVAGAVLFFALRRSPLARLGIVMFFLAAMSLGLWFSWEKLGGRINLAREGLRNPEVTYETARQIAHDFPLYGTGPNTFEPVFQLYRSSLEESWPRQLHNDWLETRITFGWAGSCLIAVTFLLAISRWFSGQGIQTGWRFATFLWLALGGCMVHALYDFPMQIYSILLLFLVICAVLTIVGRRSKTDA